MTSPSVAIVGAGVFGLSTALSLASRGWRVVVFDRTPPPHEDASSTDISKIVRADYGADVFYTDLMVQAFARWAAWNARWPRPLFHQTGFALWSTTPMVEGDFAFDSMQAVDARGMPVRRFTAGTSSPWAPGKLVDGYVSEAAGWAESGAVVAQLAQDAMAAGVELRAEAVSEVGAGRVCTAGATERFDRVVVAAGAWSPMLVPALRDHVRVVGQPVLHLRPEDPRPWSSPAWMPWAADIAKTGWYGFPVNADGIVKVAHHGQGIALEEPSQPCVPPETIEAARGFLRAYLPSLADAPLVGTRVCRYADSADGDFWVDAVPGDPQTVVATGGSGHGFKFAPVMGDIVANVVEDRADPWRDRFAWRSAPRARTEHARSTEALPGA